MSAHNPLTGSYTSIPPPKIPNTPPCPLHMVSSATRWPIAVCTLGMTML